MAEDHSPVDALRRIAVELREHGVEVPRQGLERGRTLVVLREHLLAEVVDGVPPAPEDAVVGGEPEVVEPVGHVIQAFTVTPAHRVQLRLRQRLGHQGVVVHRHGVQHGLLQQRREDVRRQRHLRCGDRALVGVHDHAGEFFAQVTHHGVFVDDHAFLQQNPLELPAQLCGVDHRVVPLIEQSTEDARSVHVIPDLPGVQPAETVLRVVGGLEVLDLPGLEGQREFTGALELAVQAEPLHGRLDGVKVLQAELGESSILGGQVVVAVLLTVGEAGGAESAVASRRRPADLGALEEHDAAGRGVFNGLQRGPQSGEPAADDDEVGVLMAAQRRLWSRPVGGVQPERGGRGVLQGAGDVEGSHGSASCHCLDDAGRGFAGLLEYQSDQPQGDERQDRHNRRHHAGGRRPAMRPRTVLACHGMTRICRFSGREPSESGQLMTGVRGTAAPASAASPAGPGVRAGPGAADQAAPGCRGCSAWAPVPVRARTA